jgi:DNA adenine methylase
LDSTALQRQNRRIARLKGIGVSRTTVLVHEECKQALNDLRPHLVDPLRAAALNAVALQLRGKKKPTNVAQVRQLSPFRYPGGKTWLVPEVRHWIVASAERASVFVEPFAGGAMAGLTVAAENLAESVVLSELDNGVAAVWETVFVGPESDVSWLCNRIVEFDVSLGSVRSVLNGAEAGRRERAFRTIIKNRMQRGGIMAAGAGLIKEGESGRGLRSRWYPETLKTRIKLLHSLREKVLFRHEDAFAVVQDYADDPHAFFFVDPPYTAGGKNAGRRLYTHNCIDHEGLFAVMASVRGSVMMTYSDSSEVRKLAQRFNFRVEHVPMKNTHHTVMKELLILKP